MSFGMALLNAAIYKWIPKIFKRFGNVGPVGGTVGGVGALGGFILPICIGLLGSNAKSIFLFTGLSGLMIFVNIGLKVSEDGVPEE